MKKIVCLLLMLLNFCGKSYAENVKFIQVTDVHLTQHNAKYLQEFVEDINNKYDNLDFIIFTGDNIDHANPEDLDTFLTIIKGLKVRPYVIAGNHDLFKSKGMTKEYYMQTVRKKLGAYHSSKSNYVFKKGNIVFLTMNGVKEIIPGANGYYHQEELLWLDKMLTKYKNKKVIIFQHFPLLNTSVKSHKLYKKDDYEQILSKHNNVIGIISGHYHENREEREGDIYHIVTKNFSNNTDYKLIEIDEENNMVYTMLIDNNDN